MLTLFGRLSHQQQQRAVAAQQLCSEVVDGAAGAQGQQDSNQNRYGAFNEEQDDRWAPNAPQGRG